MSDLDEIAASLSALERRGFVVVERPEIDLRVVYDRCVARADPDVRRVGTDCTRVHDLVTADIAFRPLWRDPLLASVAERFLGPCKLSSVLARSVHPGGGPQALHRDCADGERLVGFAWMIDAFSETNGATEIVPRGEHETVPLTGRAGTLVIYDGTLLHGYGHNATTGPRRSVQGAFVLKAMTSWLQQRAVAEPARFDALSAADRALLDLDADPPSA